MKKNVVDEEKEKGTQWMESEWCGGERGGRRRVVCSWIPLKKEHVDGKKSSFCPAKKHCDAPTEDIESCPLLLGQPCASPSKGFEGLADMYLPPFGRRTDGRTNERTEGPADERTDGQKDGRRRRPTNGGEDQRLRIRRKRKNTNEVRAFGPSKSTPKHFGAHRGARKRRLPMVTTRSMDGIDHTELLARLQAQLEQQTQMIRQQQEAFRQQQEVHQQLVAEIAQLKEKQQGETEGNSHAGNNGRRNGRNNHPHEDSGPPPPSELLPFTEEIMQTAMPDRPLPPIEKFDGTTDPENHLRNFIDSMAFYSNSDPVKCRAFSLSLKDEALEWYYTLPPNSVDNFHTVTTLFRRQFSASRKEGVSAAELVNLKQGRDEPLRTFMRRYSEMARRVKGVSHEFIISNLPNCLKPGFISESLYAELPNTMEELHEKMAKFIKMEDQRYYRKKNDAPTADDRSRNHKPPRTEPKALLGPRYDRYTQLTAPRDKIFDKAHQSNLIAVRKKRTPKNADASKMCRFHDNQGHSTEGCQGLKDEIERLVRAGYLQEFVNADVPPSADGPPSADVPPARTFPQKIRKETERIREHSRSRSRKRDPTPKGRIDTISGGFAGGGASSSARKRHMRNLYSVHTIARNPLTMPDITFTDRDFHAPDPEQDDPMVITARIAEYDVSKILIDQGSSVNILYWTTFQRMALSEEALTPFHEQIVGFAGERVDTRGYIDLKTRLGTGDRSREIRVRFLLVEAHTSYNALLGRPCLNAFGAIVSTPHLAMKFPSGKGEICTIRADQKTARQCYTASLKAATYKRQGRSETISVDLDPRTNTDDRIQPQGEIKPIALGKSEEQTTNIGADLTITNEDDLIALLRANGTLFAWSASDMPGIHPEVIAHKLSIFREARPIAQKKRRLGTEKRAAVQTEVDKLITAGFIREITYTTWLANVVMVKKPNGQWRMCVDFTDLNKACPKDNYPLPSIDRLVDGASGHAVLSFLDAYSGYNQIPMYAPDRNHTAFITEQANYCYEVMPFGLKNAGATYQRLMDKIFHNQIGRCMEVYMDDMVVRSCSHQQHLRDLTDVFEQLKKYGLRLNPSKCTFGVSAGKFLGFMLTNRGIEANPDKCRAILEMRTPTKLKEVQCLVGRLTALSRFIPRLSEHIKPILRNMKRDVPRHWDNQCEAAFSAIKNILTNPPVMSRPEEGFDIQVYLSATGHSVSAALIQEAPIFKLIYFVSRTLQGAEERYSQVEKVALALVHAARRLRPYFQSHQVVIRTDHPIAKILRKPDLAGRMVAWSIELSEFGLRFEPQGSIKGQHLADFVAELPPAEEPPVWHLNVDGSSDKRRAGAGVVLEGPNGDIVEQAISFTFQLSNNQAEYEALISGLLLATEFNVRHLECRMDSQLVVGHLNGTFQVKDNHLLRYYHKVSDLIKAFGTFRIVHIPREQNSRADLLSKLTHRQRNTQLTSVIKTRLERPLLETCTTNVSPPTADWRQDVIQLMVQQEQGAKVSMIDSKRIARFTFVGDDLYRRGYTTPLLKCLSNQEARYVMEELHHGICGSHSGQRTLRAKILRAGFYWPTIEQDCKEFVQKCISCQSHGQDARIPPSELKTIVSPWPFVQWGMDIAGPLPLGKGQCKYLLVAIDYFTKWIEADALATITARKVQSFIWRLICRFGLPQKIITDNGRQFIDRTLEDFLRGLGIKHVTSSVELPQTNGQAEAANKAIISELKKRLGQAKGLWVEELPEVLWAYRCTPHGSTGETPFNLTYGTDAMLPVEVGEPSLRRHIQDIRLNDEQLRMNLDTLPERREIALIKNEAQKRLITRRYNTKVRPRHFNEGDLVWRKRGDARRNKSHGKLADNWEGPFRVIKDLKNGAYQLEKPDGKAVPNTWNATHLKFYYS
ncbi:hypothetical protein V8G54_029207 [Vigna mungo]|uniref:Uncharacterized protein n=1 Tax=Vigna mungo TaxID=3915 RepID=A0AAQ3MU51_VIGMU